MHCACKHPLQAKDNIQQVVSMAGWLLRPPRGHPPGAPTIPQAWFSAAIKARTFTSALLVARAVIQLTLAVVAARQVCSVWWMHSWNMVAIHEVIVSVRLACSGRCMLSVTQAAAGVLM